MRIQLLPEPANPVETEISPIWLGAVAAKNWERRARQLDDAIVDSLSVIVAGGHDAPSCIGHTIIQLTAAIETVCDIEIRGVDAALFYTLSAHPEWRTAARDFLAKNRIEFEVALRARPGARLVHSIINAHATLASAVVGRTH